jgi:hypothetical protein
MEQEKKKLSLGQRWREVRPTKTLVFWSWIASVVITMIIGFAWGGWVTGSSARKIANELVVSRLAPICVAQFQKDPEKDQKLKELKETGYWQRGDYVKKQGWATMPGEEEPDSQVCEECAKLLMLISK